jgi:hypothetical protein
VSAILQCSKEEERKKKGDTQLGETITGTKKEREKINCSV